MHKQLPRFIILRRIVKVIKFFDKKQFNEIDHIKSTCGKYNKSFYNSFFCFSLFFGFLVIEKFS